jgi:hypothetical protein
MRVTATAPDVVVQVKVPSAAMQLGSKQRTRLGAEKARGQRRAAVDVVAMGSEKEIHGTEGVEGLLDLNLV